MILVAAVVALFIVGCVCLFILRAGGQKKIIQAILIDLGFAKSWSKEQESPFYKWGWRKSANDRVWGERIVKQAFEKQGVWLGADDLMFFEDVCNRHAAGEKVDEKAILVQINNILDRRGRMSNCATVVIKKLIAEIANTSDNEAKRILMKFGVSVSSENALAQYGAFRARQLNTNVGKSILIQNTGGFSVKNEQGETLYTLQGLEGWRHWIFACRDEFKKYSPSGSGDIKKALQSVKSRALNTIIKEAIEDLQGVTDFADRLENEIYKGGVQFDAAKIGKLISYFYGWQFSDGVAFNRADSKKIREFLLRKEVSSVFRSRVLAKIGPSHDSLRIAMDQFPKRVIFYGKNGPARQYICQNYLAHLVELFSAVSSITGRGYLPPSHLLVKAEDLNAARQYWARMKEMSDFERKADRNTEVHFRRDYLPELIEKQKEFSLFERDIDEEFAEIYGYLVNLGAEELTVAESAHLDKSVFRRYLQICCDPKTKIDFEGDTDKAKNERKNFFTQILQSIEDNPLLRSTSSYEEEEPSETQEDSKK